MNNEFRGMQIRDLAVQKLGLLVDRHDENLRRIVELAGESTAADAALLCVAQGNDMVTIVSTAPVGKTPHLISLQQSVVSSAQAWAGLDSQSLLDKRLMGLVTDRNPVRGLRVLPVHSPDHQAIGTLTLFSNHCVDKTDPFAGDMPHRFVRLIEDALLLRMLSVRDPMTGLHNRRFFQDQLTGEWRRALRMQVPLSFMLIDIDHFKLYNDTAGHAAGDDAIKAVSAILMETCRRAGDTLCRYGGEEFALLMPMTDVPGAMQAANKIRAAVYNSNITHPGTGNRLTVSIGTSTAASADDIENGSAAAYMAEADKALYSAKHAGRDQATHFCETPIAAYAALAT